jgi:PIN domain nuclease of toxin-antitoxin system
MRLLLDSHVLVWWWNDDPRLRPGVREQLRTTSTVFVSLASYWELGVKVSAGRLNLTDKLDVLIDSSGFEVLEIHRPHAQRAFQLPPIHANPFDRMLIAQALCEDMVLVTADRVIKLYDVPVLPA